MKYGNLNLLEPSGPLQASNGTDLSFHIRQSFAFTTVILLAVLGEQTAVNCANR